MDDGKKEGRSQRSKNEAKQRRALQQGQKLDTYSQLITSHYNIGLHRTHWTHWTIIDLFE